MPRFAASHLISLVVALALAALVTPGAALAQPASGGGFASQPAYSNEGFAFVVYRGGSMSELQAAMRGAGASGGWLQDASGRYYVLVVDSPPFLAAPVQAAFPSGFSNATAVTLVRAQRVVPSPVERAEIVAAESFPVQYFVQATFGLPNGCHTFRGVETRREGDTITITATNSEVTGGFCTQVYGYVDRNIALGSNFVSGRTYTVQINDVTRTFVAQ